MIVSTTRPISCLTERSRSGVPICPRKYLETTMLVACCDQNFGKLDVALLEHQLAALVGDERRAQLPVDLVERIDAVLGEVALELEAWNRAASRKGPAGGEWGRLSVLSLLHVNASKITRRHEGWIQPLARS